MAVDAMVMSPSVCFFVMRDRLGVVEQIEGWIGLYYVIWQGLSGLGTEIRCPLLDWKFRRGQLKGDSTPVQGIRIRVRIQAGLNLGRRGLGLIERDC